MGRLLNILASAKGSIEIHVRGVTGVAAVSGRIIPRAGSLMVGVILFWYVPVVSHNTIVRLKFFI